MNDNAVENIIEQVAGELSEDIERLELSNRSYNALKRGGIDTIGELVSSYTHGKIVALRGLGSRSYKEIEEKIVNYLN